MIKNCRVLAIFLFAFVMIGFIQLNTITASAAELNTNLLVNPGGESGDSRVGWSGGSGSTFGILTGGKTNNYLGIKNGSLASMTVSHYQDVNISSLASDIDSGSLMMNLKGYFMKETTHSDDVIKIQIQQLDGSGNPLSGAFERSCPVTKINDWRLFEVKETVAIGTRTLRVTLSGTITGDVVVSGGVFQGMIEHQGGFDDMVLTLSGNTESAPTISKIDDQYVDTGTTLGPIPFTAADAENDSLTVAASSSNQMLISNANINAVLSNGSGTITLTPTSGQTGQAVITIAVSDGTKTTRMDFNVTVYPAIYIGSNLITNGNGSSLTGWTNPEGRCTSTNGVFYVGSLASGSTKYYMYQDVDITKFGPLIDTGLAEFTSSCNTNININLGKDSNGNTMTSVNGEYKVEGFDVNGNKLWEKTSGIIDTNTRKIRVTVGGDRYAAVDDVSVVISGNPKMSDITDRNVRSGSTISIPFTVIYSGGEVALSAVSSNTAVIQDSSFTFGGSQYQRTINFDAQPGTSGTAVISVKVNGNTLKTFNVFLYTYPGKPSIVSVTSGNGQAVVEFTAPISDGGSNITSYVVTSNPDGITQKGGITETGKLCPITVAGLKNGKAYTFTVAAVNAAGKGAESDSSSSVTPATVPIVNTGEISSITENSATVGGNVAGNGGNAIIQRGIEYKPSGSDSYTQLLVGSADTGAFTANLKELLSNTEYDVRAFATNGLGTSYGAVVQFTTLKKNNIPVRKAGIGETVAGNVIVDTAYTLSLADIFEDADANSLTYKVSINGAADIAAEANYSYTSKVIGTTTLVFKANDGKADSTDTYTVTLTVNPAKITISAIVGMTTPKRGMIPVTAITETEQYTGTVVWNPGDNPFGAGTVYTATITLTPKEKYTLKGVAADYFAVDGATSVNNAADSGVITAVFPATEEITLQSIAITTPALKLLYKKGDNLDISGMVVTGIYNDGSKKTETVTAANITGFDSSMVHESQMLTVTIGGKETTYTIKICEMTYNVIFKDWDGTELKTDIVEKGKGVTAPADPIRKGYTFTGWYKESGCINSWDFTSDRVVEDTTLYAKWIQNPIVSNVKTSNKGDKIILTFSKVMADPSGNEGAFSAAVNHGGIGSAVNITGITLETDKKDMVLTLSSPVAAGDTVTLSYKPGMAASADGGKLAAFTSQAVINYVPVPVASNKVTVTPYNPVVAITSGTTISDITITVPETIRNSGVNVADILNPAQGGIIASGPLPAINIIAAVNLGGGTPVNVHVSVTSGTAISVPQSANWDGTINMPEVMAKDSVAVTPTAGTMAAVSNVIEIGSGDIPLTFDRAVRILFPNGAGKKVGYSRNGVFKRITTALSADDQNAADNLPADGDGYINVGSDLVVWTKHFTKYIVYTETPLSNPNSDNSGSTGGSSSNTGTSGTPGTVKIPERISGIDRYDTAVKIAKKYFTNGADTVVLARGDISADALTAVPLAKKHNAPLLLTPQDKLPWEVIDEIKALGAKNVIIMGGKGAVSSNIANILTNQGLTVKRISGTNRYDTAYKTAVELGITGKAVIVNGNDGSYADALSISSWAAYNNIPILYSNGTDILPEETLKALNELKVTNTILIGGYGVLPKSLERMLPNPIRYSGENCFDTNAKVLGELQSKSVNIFAATGNDFADALSGAVVAGKNDSWLMLIGSNGLTSSQTELLKSAKGNIQNIHVLGGSSVVSDNIVVKIKELTGIK